MGASAAIGPAMEPDAEAAHKQALRETYAEQAQRAVEIIETKLAGIQASLKTARAEAKRLRDEAEKGRA